MFKAKKPPLLKVMDHECFKRLSETQKIFVMRHIARDGNDALDAVKFAYPKVKPKNLMSFKCQVLRSPKVQRVLNLWLGRSEMDVLAAKLEPLLDIAIQRDKKRKRISTSTERAISMIASHIKSKSKHIFDSQHHFDDADYPTAGAAHEAAIIQAVIGKKFKQDGVWYEVVALEVKL